ncbi:MAG: hypothetical protein ABFS28_09945 [Bacteroidota bacterium]
MKTAKKILSILGVALATLSFGQLIAQTGRTPDLNMTRFIESEDEVLFYTAKYNAENGETIHWVNHIPGRYYPSVLSNVYEYPLVTKIYFAREVKASYEEIPVLESWMIIPFSNDFPEEELVVEDWMTEDWI